LYLTKPVLLSWFFIILKSIIDGADGELARIKNTSYTGRYLDSVF
jgi:phosphatidylglycerophosphate synthase